MHSKTTWQTFCHGEHKIEEGNVKTLQVLHATHTQDKHTHTHSFDFTHAAKSIVNLRIEDYDTPWQHTIIVTVQGV